MKHPRRSIPFLALVACSSPTPPKAQRSIAVPEASASQPLATEAEPTPSAAASATPPAPSAPSAPEPTAGMDTDTAGACDDRGKTRHDRDINGDGKPDIYELRSLPTPDEPGYLRCRRIDLDYDGNVDVTEFYNRTGERVRSESDLNSDGKVDVTAFYNSGGVKIRTETDLDGNGTIDATTTYDPVTGAKLSTKLAK